MTSGTRFTRRTAIATASALGAGFIAWAPALAMTRSKDKDEETFESDDGSLTVTYDPGIWLDINGADPQYSSITLATDATYGRPRYWLALAHGQPKWDTVEAVAANAQADWFSQGMNGSIVTEDFQTENAYGWIHYADFQGNPRTVSVLQYQQNDDGMWFIVQLSIDAEAFEDLDITEVFDAVSLNEGSVFVIASQRTMIRAIEDAFAA